MTDPDPVGALASLVQQWREKAANHAACAIQERRHRSLFGRDEHAERNEMTQEILAHCTRARADELDAALTRLIAPRLQEEQDTPEWRAVVGALRSTIDAHGPVTKPLIHSATKRILGALQQQYAQQPGGLIAPPEGQL